MVELIYETKNVVTLERNDGFLSKNMVAPLVQLQTASQFAGACLSHFLMSVSAVSVGYQLRLVRI